MLTVTTVRFDQAELKNISINHDVPTELWDAFVKSHPHGSVFHVMAWQRLIQASLGHEPQHLVARDSLCGAVVGVLPLFLVRSLIFGR
jgi:hypothetical protein